MRSGWKPALAILGVMAAGAAQAHTGHAEGSGLIAGFMHPILGWDHIATMVAVGLWAAFLGRPAIWLLPLSFVAVMALGGAAGAAGLSLPGIETAIAASAVVIGLAVLLAARPPVAIAAVVVAFFAVFHGHAHGAEMPSGASPLAYALGFVGATALLHLAGIGSGLLLRSGAGRLAFRAMGGLIALAGAGFLSGAI